MLARSRIRALVSPQRLSQSARVLPLQLDRIRGRHTARAVEVAPFPVRVGLVGVSTMLFTPLMPVIGFNQLVFRFVDPATRMAIHGGTSMLYFSVMTLAPNSFYYAPLLLPFALGNGVTAAAFYAALEKAAGSPEKVAGVAGYFPAAGIALGVASALVAPFLFPICWELTLPSGEGDSWATVFDFQWALNFNLYECISEWTFGPDFGWIVWPCLATTGAASGAIIHVLLRPVILGWPGVPWQQFALRVLGASLLGLAALYSSSLRTHGMSHVLELPQEELRQLRDLSWFSLDHFFHRELPCYVNGKAELLWAPGLDLETGEPLSVLCDGAKERHTEKGTSSCSRSQKIAVSASCHKKVKCYKSRRDCYFEFNSRQLDVNSIASTLPAAEALVTDVTVLLASGFSQEVLTDSLNAVLSSYDLGQTALGKRSQQEQGLLHSGRHWVNHLESSVSLLRVLRLHAAQLRELLRLPQQDIQAKSLSLALERAGVDVERARDILLSKPSFRNSLTDAELRARDLACIRGEEFRDRMAIANNIFKASLVAALLAASTWSWSQL